MDRIRKLWRNEQPYEPIEDASTEDFRDHDGDKKPAFSYIDYSIFLLLGVSMLWAWNMFLAAGPYFQTRFRDSAWITENFQAAEVSVSTIANLGSMLVLTKMQEGASYPKRIIVSLFINMVGFLLLALSTSVFGNVSAGWYFGFLLVMILSTSLATGLCQNGIFAYVSGFGEPRYTHGIMTGQAVAGVLPCIAQIVSVLSVSASDDQPTEGRPPGPPGAPPVHPTAALAYFLTATAIAVATLFAFFVLLTRHRKPAKTIDNTATDTSNESADKKEVPITILFRKLFWLASAVFVTFGVTMIFPVFTQRIVSVRAPADQHRWLQAPSFIPLAFLLWNTGDLIGRLVTAIPSLSLVEQPRLVFVLSVLRLGFVGMYRKYQDYVISQRWYFAVAQC